MFSSLHTNLKPQTCNILEKLKASLCAETKSWRVAYGKLCNTKYLNEMELIFSSVEDWVKRLNRPIKDLDDIRLAMETLKEIREKEISIDMMIGPVEVDSHVYCSDEILKYDVVVACDVIAYL